jgi:hypothetical protein
VTPFPERTFRTVQSSDGFIAVRALPSSSSEEVLRLPSGAELFCAGTVSSERLTLLGVTTDQWFSCPGAGGYIFAPLLIDVSVAPATPTASAAPSDERDAIIAAVRAYLGSGIGYQVSEPCVDRDHALSIVTADGGAAEDGLALLQRAATVWEVIVVGPTMLALYPEELVRLGAPADFACLSGG